jgi:molybdenum cofactor synthesis domain-containing protein
MGERLKSAVLTISTRSSAGEREDTSGQTICALVNKNLGDVVLYKVLPDDVELIKRELICICDQEVADVVFTLGGTGLAPTDFTPDATRLVIEREVPGISETIRNKSLEKTDRAMLSRGISGVRKHTLIINMPGSERAVRESFEIVRGVISHAVELINGEVKDCGRKKE